jgi:hypothetical protein
VDVPRIKTQIGALLICIQVLPLLRVKERENFADEGSAIINLGISKNYLTKYSEFHAKFLTEIFDGLEVDSDCELPYEICCQIIQGGETESKISLALTNLQMAYETKVGHPLANVGKEDGFKLTRCLFSVLLKLNNKDIDMFLTFIEAVNS